MAKIKVVTERDVGKGLEIANQKLNVVVDDVTIKIVDNKLVVQIPELLVVSAEADNLAEVKDDGIFVGKAKVVEAVKDPETVKALAELLKGDNLQGLDGTSIGYVLPNTGTASDA